MTNQLINIAEDQITLCNPNKSSSTSKRTELILSSFVLHFSPFLYPLLISFSPFSFIFLGHSMLSLSFSSHLISSPTLTWKKHETEDVHTHHIFESKFIIPDLLLESVWAEIFSVSLRNNSMFQFTWDWHVHTAIFKVDNQQGQGTLLNIL